MAIKRFVRFSAANTEDVTEEVLTGARHWLVAVGRTVSVSKKGYIVLIPDLANDIRTVCRGAEASTARMTDWEDMWSVLYLKFQQQAEKDGCDRDVEKLFDAKRRELQVVKEDMEATEPVLNEQSRDKRTLEIELKSA